MTAKHYEGQDLEALADMPRYANWIVSEFAHHLKGRVIEVGAGIGNVSKRYVDGAEHALLVEPASNLYPQLVDRFSGHPHVQTANTLLQDVPADLLREPFDAAIMVNVLEHVQDDEGCLQRLNELLGERGKLLLFVPALPMLYGTLDTLVHHYRRYTFESLAGVLQRSGFYPVRLRYFDVAGMLPWLIAGRLLRRKRFDPAGARLYDRFGVPLTAFVERHIVPPLGKSLTCIACKKYR
jgi:SAM-dependent methyltransferase